MPLPKIPSTPLVEYPNVTSFSCNSLVILPLAPFLSIGHPANVAGPAMPSTFCLL